MKAEPARSDADLYDRCEKKHSPMQIVIRSILASLTLQLIRGTVVLVNPHTSICEVILRRFQNMEIY